MLDIMLLSEMTMSVDETALWVLVAVPLGLGLGFYLLVRYVNWQFDRRLDVEQPAVDKAPIGAWLMLALALVIFLFLLKYYSALGSASAF